MNPPPPPASSAIPAEIARAYLPDATPHIGPNPLAPLTAWHCILLKRLGNPVLDIVDGRPVLGGDYDSYATAAFILSLPPEDLVTLYESGRLPAARDQWLRTLSDPVLLVTLAETVATHLLTPFAAYLTPFRPVDPADVKKKTHPSPAGSSPSSAPSPEPTTPPSATSSPAPSPKSSSTTPSSATPPPTSNQPAPHPTSSP